MKIGVKLMVFFLLLSIVPVIVVGGYYNFEAQKTIEEKVGSFAQQLVKQNGRNIDSKIIELEKILNTVSGNKELVDLIAKGPNDIPIKESKRTQTIKSMFDSIIYTNQDIKSIILIPFDEEVQIYGERMYSIFTDDEIPAYSLYFHQNRKEFEESKVYQKVLEAKGKPVWITGLNENYQKIFLMKRFSHFDLAKPLGVIVFAIDKSTFTELYADVDKDKDTATFIINEKKRIIDHENKEKLGQKLLDRYRNKIEKGDPYGIFINNGELVSYSTVDNGWKLISSVPMYSLTKDIDKVGETTFIVGVVCILLSVGISTLFSRNMSKRINILVNKMLKVEKGDMEIKQTIKGKDELGILDGHFNRMIERLQNLININYVQQLEKRQAELSALQYQINPHFLYNTLETINSIASVYGCFEIRTISQKLGEMFRYNMSIQGSELIALQKELNHIENYIYLQQMQYDEPFEVFYDIEDGTKKCKVLKFILQPIVENAIRHGFKDRSGKGTIEISSFIENNYLFLTVQDDGKGMTEEKVKELNDYINEKQEQVLTGYKKSIGMRNVNLRIKLCCGDLYGMAVKSKENMGTQVVFKLPVYGRLGGKKSV